MRKAYILLPLLGGLLLASCDDDTTEPTPTLTLTVGEAITIVQGQSASTTITVTRGGGYDDEVDLTVSNLPAGVTATLDPQQIPAGSGPGTSTLTLTADATATTGTAQFTIEAEATTRAGLVANTTGSVTVNESPGFSLAVDPAALEVAAGASGTSNLTITRTGGFADAVNLTVNNLPTGVTASFDNAAPTGDAAVLTLTADATAAAGTTTVTVSGTGTPGTQTADIALTITAPASGFSLALDPAALTVNAGQSGTSTVNLTRTGGFTGPVTLTATGAPDGVTVAFDPADAGAETSTATVTVASTVAPGDYPIVVHGNAEGQTEATSTLTLTVGAAVNGFTVTLNPTTLSVGAGGTGTSTVTVNKTGTFTGPVNLSVTNLPTGVTAAFNPAAASPGKKPQSAKDVQTTSTLTLTVDAAVVPGDYPLTVRGAAEGLENSDATLTLTVTAPVNGFTITLPSGTINAQAGGTSNTTITINKTGTFTGPVTLSLDGLPTGVTGSFNPASASPPRSSSVRRDEQVTSTLTLNVAADVAPGQYEFQIKANAEGQAESSSTVTLSVSPPPAPGNTTFKFCDLNSLPVWVAFEDGTGAGWTSVPGTVESDGTTYSFDITQTTGGVAYVTGDATNGFNTFVFYGSQAELIAMGNAQCTEQPNTNRTLNGTIANIGATDQVNIAMGGANAFANGALLNFTLNNVLNGPADLFATQSTVAVGPPVAVTPVKMIIRRALDIPDGGTIPVLDFAAAEAFAPQTATVTLNNLGADEPITFLSYLTATTSGALYTTPGAAGSTQTVYGVPAANQQAGDLHALNVIAGNTAAPGDSRGHFEWFNALTDKTVTLGPVLNAPTIAAIAGSAYPRYSATAAVQPEYDDSFVFSLAQAGASARSTIVTATKGYLAGAADYTLAIPDLTTAGYQAAWGLATGTPVTTSTGAFGFSGTGTTLPREEGGTADFATRGGSVTPAAVSRVSRRP